MLNPKTRGDLGVGPLLLQALVGGLPYLAGHAATLTWGRRASIRRYPP